MLENNFDKQKLDNLVKEVKADPGWYQTIDFGDGTVVSGRKDTREDIENYKFPKDMTGKTYLEIGSNLGGTCLEMYRRGAKKVVGVEINPDYVRWSKEVAELAGAPEIEYYLFDADKESIAEKFGKFDVIGVFSVIHLSPPIETQVFDPRRMLKNIYDATDELFVTEISNLVRAQYLSPKDWYYNFYKKGLIKKYLQSCQWSNVEYIGKAKKKRFVFHCHK